MTPTRKASIALSVPAALMSIWWVMTYCCPPLGLAQPLQPYLFGLMYLTYAGAALAVGLFLLAHRSRDSIVCLAINLLGVALNLFGPRLLSDRIVPYIRF